MNWDQIAGQWKQFSGSVKQEWGKFPMTIWSTSAARKTNLSAGCRKSMGSPKRKPTGAPNDGCRGKRSREERHSTSQIGAIASHRGAIAPILRSSLLVAALVRVYWLRLLVRAAFCADIERSLLPRLRAAERACRANAGFDAAAEPSRRSAVSVARERAGDGLAPDRDLLIASSAPRRVFVLAFPFLGGGKLTPARRAFESPIAMACFVDRAPCFPSRM